MEQKLDAILARLAVIEAGMGSPAKAYLDTREAAEYTGIGKATLEEWRMRANDGPPYVKMAKKVLYAVADLDRFMAERRVEVLK